MSALTNGLGAAQFSAGGSSSMLVQPATCDADAVLVAPVPALAERRFLSRWLVGPKSVISGITKDSAGSPLGTVVVRIFLTSTNVLRNTVSGAGSLTSDANGAYGFEMNDQLASYIVAYKTQTPDVTGATVNTLVGA